MPPALRALVAELEGALVDGGLFSASTARDFVPHLTLVRKMARHPAAEELQADWPPLTWPVSEFVLLQSQRDSHGSHYATLAQFPADDDADI